MKRGIMHLLPFNLESASSSIADSEMNRGDLTPLVYGFLKILSGMIEDTIGVLKRKKDQLQRYEKKIDALGFHDKLMEEMYYILLQAAFFYGRGVTITELTDMVGKARNTIQKRLVSMFDFALFIFMQCAESSDANSDLFKEGYDEAPYENTYEIDRCNLIRVSLNQVQFFKGVTLMVMGCRAKGLFNRFSG